MTIPKRVSERFARAIGEFQQVLKQAKAHDVNESDTSLIIKDILHEVFGYDKYLDITSERPIRGAYCDIAIKVNNKIEFVIEVKAIGLDLKESHVRQATDYGANEGVNWIILTNGIDWYVYNIRFEQPISRDIICSFNLLELDPKIEENQEKLFLISKEGLGKDIREEYHEKILNLNRFTLSALILSDEIVNQIRRELRKVSDGVLASPEEILNILSNEVLKRDVLEGEEAIKAQNRVKKFYIKAARKPKETSPEKAVDEPQVKSEIVTPAPTSIQDKEKKPE